MTRNLCAHPAQFLNPTISKFCYSSYMVIISLYNSKILLSLQRFLTPQFQTFTKIRHLFSLIQVERMCHLQLILLVIILCYSNNTVFALDISVNKKAPPTHSVRWGLNPPTSKTSSLLVFICKFPLKFANYPSHPSWPIHLPHSPLKNCFFMNLLPPKNWILQ